MTPPSDDRGGPAAAAQIQATFLEGWAQHQRGQLGQAWTLYQEVIARQPRHFDALHLAGIIAAQTGRLDQAVELIGRAVEIDPTNAGALYNRGNALADLGRHQDAVACFDRAITRDPSQAEPYNNRGNALWALKRHQEAVADFDKAIAINPGFAEAHNNRGNAMRDLKQLDAAVASFDRAIALNPNYAAAYNNRGNALRDLKQLEAAVAGFDRAIALNPNYAEAYNNRGNALRDLKRLEAACTDYDRAVALKADYADAYYNRGIAQRALKQFEAAVVSYGQAIAIKPDHAEAHNSRGLALASLKRFDAAIDDYNRAIAHRPDYAEAYNNRGAALAELRRHEEALASYDQAIQIKPDYAEAYNNSGIAFKDLNQNAAALGCYDKAIAINPESAEAYNNRGLVLNDLKQFEAAIASYSKALHINPRYAFLYGLRLYTKLTICDWQDFEAEIAELRERIARGESASPPFSLLTLIGTPDLLLKGARIWSEEQFPRSTVRGAVPKPPRHDRIRLGYFSMDFHDHPVSQLLAGVIEAHDRAKFEVIAVSYGPASEGDLRKRMEAAFDRFIDARAMSDIEMVDLARRMELDIAIDLAGSTGQPRTNIFAMGAAPVQVNYLGYPGTMGADYYDYIIADRTVIPEEARPHYGEKVVYLTHSYQPNDARRKMSDRVFTREELGLPPTGKGFVFSCFNNNIKILPGTFSAWMRILKRVEGSVLWLLEDPRSTAAANLRAEATQRGVDAGRLVFAPRAPYGDNLARQRAADLFLDTLPYNAHTTASDALWAGLPVLTCLGESFAGRVAASILEALDLPELITPSLAAFEDRAVELAGNPAMLEAIKQKLARNRTTAPLFNAALYARHLEDAYAQMVARARAGLPPEHISVKS